MIPRKGEPAAPPPNHLFRARRRVTGSIFAGVALGHTAVFAAFTVAPLAVVEATGSSALSGLPGATSVAGTAAGAALLSAVMARRGRRAGLLVGYVLGVVGSGLGVVAVARASLVLLVGAMGLVGMGHGANQLARFAAADAQPSARRATVLSWVVWAGTIGAVSGPSLLRPFELAADALGRPGLAGGFLVAVAFYCGAAAVCTLWLRPDPSALAEDEPPAPGTPSPETAPGSPWTLPRVRIAVLALVSAQVAMVLVMTLTPVHIHEAGHALRVVGFVMSAHFVGMYGLAPVAGWLGDRLGRIPVALAGLGMLAVASLGAALSPAAASGLLGLWLWVLGTGWSFAFVAGSALLTSGFSIPERTLLQGRVDTVVWSASAVASLSSGALVAVAGYRVLCLVGALAVLGPTALIAARRRAAPAERVA
jgi:MFS family permease